MNIRDLKFPHDGEYNLLTMLTESCLGHGVHQEEVRTLLNEAADTEDFINKVVHDEALKRTQLYAELIKRERPEMRWKAIRSMFGDKCFKTVSDVGGVLVGADTFSVVVPNGRGSGITRVAVFENCFEFNLDLMHRTGLSMEGRFSIYDHEYHLGSSPIMELNGRYMTYYYDGLVAFVKYGRAA